MSDEEEEEVNDKKPYDTDNSEDEEETPWVKDAEEEAFGAKASSKKSSSDQFTSVKLCSKFGAFIYTDDGISFIQTSTQNVRQQCATEEA